MRSPPRAEQGNSPIPTATREADVAASEVALEPLEAVEDEGDATDDLATPTAPADTRQALLARAARELGSLLDALADATNQLVTMPPSRMSDEEAVEHATLTSLVDEVPRLFAGLRKVVAALGEMPKEPTSFDAEEDSDSDEEEDDDE
jgi:hypothetical protein